jgi:rod shape-determining protein MreC
VNKLLSRRRAIVTCVSVILLATLIYSTARDRERLSVAEHVLREVFAPVARGANYVSRTVSSWVSFVVSIGRMKRENEALSAEVDHLRSEVVQLSEAARENARLSSLLQLTSSLEGRTVAARVVYRDPGSWLESAVIDKGSGQGLASGMAVVGPRGVIGRTTSVTAHTATVLFAIDPRSAIGGIDSRSRDLVIAEGIGDGSGLLQVRPIGAECDIVAGDVIVTSGMGGIYPKGHIVADVISVEQDKYGVSKTAVARPRVDFQRLEEVLVLIDPARGAAR